MPESPNLGITHLEQNADTPHVVVNDAIDALDNAFNNRQTLTATTGGSPTETNVTVTEAQFTGSVFLDVGGSPTTTVRLIVPDTERLYAVRNNTGQTMTIGPSGGTTVNLADGAQGVFYNDGATSTYELGSATATGQIYDVGTFVQGTPQDGSQVIFVSPRAFTLAAGASGQAYAGTAPGASEQITLQKNGSNIGTVTFSAGSNTGTISISSETSFAAGDRLQFIFPSGSPALGMADVAITLTGTR